VVVDAGLDGEQLGGNFDTADEAQSFFGFLSTQVWTNPENSPGLAGTPEAMVLEPAAIWSSDEARSGA
jgi:hypothetical protein